MSYDKPAVRVEGGQVILNTGADYAISADEATELGQKLHVAASAVRLAKVAQRRYDIEREAIQRVLDRKGK